MRTPVFLSRGAWRTITACAAVCAALHTGCQTALPPTADELNVRDAIEHYSAAHSDRLADLERTQADTREARLASDVLAAFSHHRASSSSRATPQRSGPNAAMVLLGTFGEDPPPATSPVASPDAEPLSQQTDVNLKLFAPEGYWRRDIWHQMGHEALSLGQHDFWHGFKVTYWNVPNVALLTATLGGSLAIQGTGVDATVRERTEGHRVLGDWDETIQILGHPGTHFAATGVLWLGSAITQRMKEHEVAKALTQALAVNGVSTILLKAAANTRTPDDEHFGWPSGHTSSAFTAAAVLNEYYGPWVGVPSFALAGLVGYQRIDSRVHDFSDVVFGAMLGYVIGTSIARDDKAQFPELFGMKVIPYVEPESGSTGLALLKQW